MAKASWEVIATLRSTADRLAKSTDYQWGHMGSCNCGFLAREITHLKKDEIHKRAMQRYGDWSEQLNDYCPSSGLLMDNLISELLSVGFDTADLKHLERLSDPRILNSIPPETRNLRHNNKADVIFYFHQWASVLENEIISDERVYVLEFACV
jgi:hypothetical protein